MVQGPDSSSAAAACVLPVPPLLLCRQESQLDVVSTTLNQPADAQT